MVKNAYPGKFIVIEGLDGSGKSVQVEMLVDFLRGQGKDVLLTREPTFDSEAGKMIRRALKKEISLEPFQLQQLFVQDRKEHLENEIIPALKAGKMVISARYAFSTFAYGYSEGLNVNKLMEMNSEFLLPDLTVILDMLPENCIIRIESRGGDREYFEQLATLERVNEMYRRIPMVFPRVFAVDGERDVLEVFEDIKKLCEQHIKITDAFAPEFEDLQLSQEDQHLVGPFFTNLDKPAYAITFLPPEIIGALCSRASRAKDDLRLSLLKEFIKPFLEGEGEYPESLKALIEFLHKHPAERIFANPKAREFYVKWLAQFGDDSIAQMAGTHLIYTGISQLAIKQIEDMRLGIAPIEKSTRYVDYSSKVNGKYRYYADPTLEEIGLMTEYRATMDHLFDVYTELLQEYGAFLKTQYPGEEERVIKTKAFDTARLLLPVSTLSQLALFANGQAFEYMINRGLDHKLGEVRWTSRAAREELNKVIPAFLRRLESRDSMEYRSYLMERGAVADGIAESMESREEMSVNQPPVKLLEFDAEGEDKIIAGLLYGHTNEPFDVVLGRVKEFSVQEKERILYEILKNRKAKYYKIPRAFEHIYVRFELLLNIGAWRDIHRHRIQTQVRQRFTVEHGFDVPDGLREAGLDGKYIAAVQRAEALFKKIAAYDKDLAQYCCVLGHRVRFMQYQNMRSFFWEAELRTTAQGHPDYRKIEQEKVRQIQRIYPLVSKYLMVDMRDHDFARRGDAAKIESKERELREYLNKERV